MGYTQDDLARVEAAIAQDERRVAFRDKVVDFRSLEDLKAARSEILEDLGGGPTATAPGPVRRFATRTGWSR